METLPELTEAEDTVLDTNSKIPLYDLKVPTSHSGNHLHLDVPDSVPHTDDPDNINQSDAESSEGIVFHVPESSEHDALLDGHNDDDSDVIHQDNGDESYMPALPSYSDSGAFLSKYANQPVIDYREPKQLTEKDKEDLIAAKRWRSFSIESAGAGQDGNCQKPDDVTVEIHSPWADSPTSTPPRSYMDEFGSGGPRRSERTFNDESRF